MAPTELYTSSHELLLCYLKFETGTCHRKGSLDGTPRAVNPHFTGRMRILKTLREQLCRGEYAITQGKQKRLVIYGMGGSGKSEVFLNFANDNRDRYLCPFA